MRKWCWIKCHLAAFFVDSDILYCAKIHCKCPQSVVCYSCSINTLPSCWRLKLLTVSKHFPIIFSLFFSFISACFVMPLKKSWKRVRLHPMARREPVHQSTPPSSLNQGTSTKQHNSKHVSSPAVVLQGNKKENQGNGKQSWADLCQAKKKKNN